MTGLRPDTRAFTVNLLDAPLCRHRFYKANVVENDVVRDSVGKPIATAFCTLYGNVRCHIEADNKCMVDHFVDFFPKMQTTLRELHSEDQCLCVHDIPEELRLVCNEPEPEPEKSLEDFEFPSYNEDDWRIDK